MKSLDNLAVSTLHEMGVWCAVSTDQDAKTVLGRFKAEGESFLTITLPTFGKAFERCLELGALDPNLFRPYWRVRGGHPVFLQGFLGLVFDLQTGALLDVPNVTAIRAVRQLTLMFGKIHLDCSDERTAKAFAKYVETDRTVGDLDDRRDHSSRLDFVHMAGRLWGNLLSRVDSRIHARDYLPKHGSGSTADKLIGNQKYANRLWSSRLDKIVSGQDMLLSSWSQHATEEIQVLSPGAEIPVKVISVPKTPKTPRLIAMEPTYMQYMQQALLEVMVDEIESDVLASRLIRFDSQVPNQEMARRGSLGEGFATLDLSDASDRVSVQHVADLLRRHRLTRGFVFASRSTKADVRGTEIRLRKYASMGSALCFPMESLVFMTVVFLGIQRALGHPLTRKEINHLSRKVRTFGDDIIVPDRFAPHVVQELETYGLKVNREKSFWSGKFRESCGTDWYDGHSVSVVRVRQPLPERHGDAEQVVATSSLRNQLAKAGFQKVVAELDDLLRDVLPGPYPWVSESSELVGRVDWDGGRKTIDRYCKDLQVPLTKGFKVQAAEPANETDGYDALLKFFLKRGKPPLGLEHLTHSGRPRSVYLKIEWASA